MRLTVVVDNSTVKGPTSVADSLLAVVTDKPSAAVARPQAVVTTRKQPMGTGWKRP